MEALGVAIHITNRLIATLAAFPIGWALDHRWHAYADAADGWRFLAGFTNLILGIVWAIGLNMWFQVEPWKR